MSICRFFWDGSDVYVFHHVGGYLTCCGCHLGPPDFRCEPGDNEAMVEHLREHVEAGHTVPEYAFDHFGAEHPEPKRAEAARDDWRGEHYGEYGYMWDGDHPKWDGDPPEYLTADHPAPDEEQGDG